MKKEKKKEKEIENEKFKNIKILLKIVHVSADHATLAGRQLVSKIRSKLVGNN